MGRQHDLGVDKLCLLVVEFCFLVVLAEQPFAALISGPGTVSYTHLLGVGNRPAAGLHRTIGISATPSSL